MTDLVKLQFSLEDNIILIKEMIGLQLEHEKKNTILNSTRQQITSVGLMNQLGNTWIHLSDNLGPPPSIYNIGTFNFFLFKQVF